MKAQSCPDSGSVLSKVPLAHVMLVCLLLLGVGAARTEAQTFISGSDGSDGVFLAFGTPGTVVVFDPSQYQGTQVSANIFNFTTITIQPGVTVRLGGDKVSGPVYWLAQGDVDIAGIVDLNGGAGHGGGANPFVRVASVPGAGGYAGGVGGSFNQAATAGNGPGGGTANIPLSYGYPPNPGGSFTGNQFLIPLIGGSGGGGLQTVDATFGGGGGAGGGAILIASSTQIILKGGSQIQANGGGNGAGGSGGAVRLVSNAITGSGSVSANGTLNFCCATPGPGAQFFVNSFGGGGGRVRLEAYNISANIGIIGAAKSQSAPFPLFLPTVGPALAKVISIGGNPISPNPNTFPDITINTAAPVPVVIQTQNIPVSATIKLTILNQNGVPDTVIQAPPLSNCDQDNVCTTSVNVIFPYGGSRGLTKVTWTQ